jgi:nucleoside-diphosphate-sugar epimerase
MKILVTGSNGYIGRHLCAMLEEKNYEVLSDIGHGKISF